MYLYELINARLVNGFDKAKPTPRRESLAPQCFPAMCPSALTETA